MTLLIAPTSTNYLSFIIYLYEFSDASSSFRLCCMIEYMPHNYIDTSRELMDHFPAIVRVIFKSKHKRDKRRRADKLCTVKYCTCTLICSHLPSHHEKEE